MHGDGSVIEQSQGSTSKERMDRLVLSVGRWDDVVGISTGSQGSGIDLVGLGHWDP